MLLCSSSPPLVTAWLLSIHTLEVSSIVPVSGAVRGAVLLEREPRIDSSYGLCAQQ